MIDKTYLYHPFHTSKPFSDGIWVTGEKVIHMKFPLGIKVSFSTHMTVMCLNDDGLWCHSPVEPTPRLLRRIDTLGEVRHLASPDKIHYAHITAWKRYHPQALAWASSGAREWAASQHIVVRFDVDPGAAVSSQWVDDSTQMPFAGGATTEGTVFFYRASRILVLADLIKNFETAKLPNRFQASVMELTDIAYPGDKAPADWCITSKDKTVACACLEQMLDRQPERIILARGHCYETGGTNELHCTFRWLNQLCGGCFVEK